ncbi:MAG: hypothetical protein HOW97_10010, partial [Catenulispora sp.]|nr:hypothetical protein [Catenulispora sp.]
MNAIVRRGAAAQRTALLLISLLVAVTAVAVFAIPGYLDAHRGSALRGALAAARDQVRIGVTETGQLNPRSAPAAGTNAIELADTWSRTSLPPAVRSVVGAPQAVVGTNGGGQP